MRGFECERQAGESERSKDCEPGGTSKCGQAIASRREACEPVGAVRNELKGEVRK